MGFYDMGYDALKRVSWDWVLVNGYWFQSYYHQ